MLIVVVIQTHFTWQTVKYRVNICCGTRLRPFRPFQNLMIVWQIFWLWMSSIFTIYKHFILALLKKKNWWRYHKNQKSFKEMVITITKKTSDNENAFPFSFNIRNNGNTKISAFLNFGNSDFLTPNYWTATAERLWFILNTPCNVAILAYFVPNTYLPFGICRIWP